MSTPRLVGYRTLLRSSVVEALRKIFPMDIGYGDYRLDKLRVSISYPIEQSAFPHIMVEYTESEVESMSIGDAAVVSDEDGDYHHWRFAGEISLEVQALNAYELDLILDGLVMALGVDNSISVEMDDSPLSVNFQTKSLRFGVQATSGGPVFDDGGVIYMGSLRFPVQGDFYTRRVSDGEAIFIETIRVVAEVE